MEADLEPFIAKQNQKFLMACISQCTANEGKSCETLCYNWPNLLFLHYSSRGCIACYLELSECITGLGWRSSMAVPTRFNALKLLSIAVHSTGVRLWYWDVRNDSLDFMVPAQQGKLLTTWDPTWAGASTCLWWPLGVSDSQPTSTATATKTVGSLVCSASWVLQDKFRRSVVHFFGQSWHRGHNTGLQWLGNGILVSTNSSSTHCVETETIAAARALGFALELGLNSVILEGDWNTHEIIDGGFTICSFIWS